MSMFVWWQLTYKNEIIRVLLIKSSVDVTFLQKAVDHGCMKWFPADLHYTHWQDAKRCIGWLDTINSLKWQTISKEALDSLESVYLQLAKQRQRASNESHFILFLHGYPSIRDIASLQITSDSFHTPFLRCLAQLYM